MSSAETKVALVTGSSSGIGEATVILFAKKGYKVVVCGSDAKKVNRVAEECTKASQGKHMVLALTLDFKDPQNGDVVVMKTIEHFGRLDVLVNNAGIFKVTSHTEPEKSYEIYKEIMSINLDAAVRATIASAKHLRQTKGNLIFVSSIAALRPTSSAFAYCMSKSATSMLGKCFAVELAPDVRVNIVSPGPVKTSIMERVGVSMDSVGPIMEAMTLQGRMGEAHEIASLIYYLVSEKGEFISGQEVVIDGGYNLKSYSSVHQNMK